MKTRKRSTKRSTEKPIKRATAKKQPSPRKTAKAKAGFKRPVFHHALLKTPRMDEMIKWYADVVGTAPNFYAPGIAFLSNDDANHRISLAGSSNFRDNPEFRTTAGMHHLAFEYDTVDDLLDTWRRLRDEFGYEPHVAVHHGMTLSFYYVDPDGNSVELQADAFGNWKKSTKWMRESAEFKADPIGKFVAPAKMVEARAKGIKTKELLKRAYAGQYQPSVAYDYRLELPG
ncbi:MAG TPA: VOC family protein [Xanthobacteraceae bacterium]|nr:VOC family protein [Xanthobacteraceae bacterium]